MKRLWLMLGLVLLLALPAGTALGAGAYFFMGDPSDNVTTLTVAVEQAHASAYKMSMQPYNADTGPGYTLTLVKMSPGDPCRNGGQQPSPQGNYKVILLPGPDDLSELYVQMSPGNNFNQSHHLTFEWFTSCHQMALIKAVSN